MIAVSGGHRFAVGDEVEVEGQRLRVVEAGEYNLRMDVVKADAQDALTAWQKIGPKNQAVIEGAGALLLGGVVQVVVNQLTSGVFDGHEVLRALEVGAASAIVYVFAYLRGHVTGLMTPTP